MSEKSNSQESSLYHYGAGTNVGNVRDNNEDSYVCDDAKDLWIVADGMGGLGFGEVASAITNYTVTKMVREGHGINQAIELAHKNIKEYAKSDGLGTNMGTTIVLLLSHGSLYNIFWVGDSRAYMFDKNKSKLKQITVDHSLVQSLIDEGELTKEEAESDPRKNAVTRALGVQELETVRADSISERWKPGQKILLCSDGLTDCVSDEDIEAIMAEGGDDDQEVVDKLIEAALQGGGKDNVTVVIVSAPRTVKSAETDTYVPAGDDTHVPSGDDTYVPSPDDSQAHPQAARPVQLGFNIYDEEKDQGIPVLEDVVKLTNQEELTTKNEQPVVRYPMSNAMVAAGFFLLVTASLVMTSPEDVDAIQEIPENFLVEDLSPATPLERHFPEFQFPTDGEVLQLGLFARLAGAESHQTELAGLGLAPHIEKRVTAETVKYAVVLGPLDEQDHKIALRTLDRHKLQYFHRQSRGS
ncbi:MAG: serine/threonine-protein phosphatase [Pseudomonadales bacterium]|nr:serine/threonine-protein phosphatase [Pseudomonadales bacterium]MBO6597624.1 serine/threonine-protein phosphatase [Pseudomonadales bacterium]MBO6823862.1 serine/threonine-protein phosphatase [Pseudomonadales bacterium]